MRSSRRCGAGRSPRLRPARRLGASGGHPPGGAGARSTHRRASRFPTSSRRRDLDLRGRWRLCPGLSGRRSPCSTSMTVPVAEVAELMGCSASDRQVHLHRARQRLAQALTPIEDGHG